MKLFHALLRFKPKLPNGHIYHGKHRIVKPVTKEDLRKLRDNFEIEERNMFLLRHSFLTQEQSFGHSKALGLPEAAFFNKILNKKKDFYQSVSIESRLSHLRHKESWD